MAESMQRLVERTQTVTLTCDVPDSHETQVSPLISVLRTGVTHVYLYKMSFRLKIMGFKLKNIVLRRCYNTRESPLSNIRVLDLTRIVAGPYCTMILGDMGAEIIKIENPNGGDESRKWGPPFVNNTSESCYFLSLNRNKKSVCVDLKHPEGRDLVKHLASKCDVLVENYVPGKLEKLGLGYSDISKVVPEIVYCSLTGYGSVGRYSNRPGYDVIAASIGGLINITGPQDGEPCKVGVALTDMSTGLYAHGAILAALYQRTHTGKGQKIECNLLSTQLACLINAGSSYLNAGVEGQRWGSSHPSIVPYRCYKTADNRFLTVGAGSDKQFANLCEKLNVPDLAKDERFASNKDRVRNREVLDKLLSDRFKVKSLSEWESILANASFPFGPVNSLKEAFDDGHVKDIGLVEEVEHPVAGNVKMVGPAVKFSGSANIVRSPPPTLGQHTDTVLTQLLGYSKSQIDSLKKHAIIV